MLVVITSLPFVAAWGLTREQLMNDKIDKVIDTGAEKDEVVCE